MVLFGILLVLGVPRASRADFPEITWDVGNNPVPVHTAGPLARDWTWECDDPADDLPITLRCRTFDLTAGDLGSGQEILLTDDDCGTFGSDPASTTFHYDVPVPVTDHKYGYAAYCMDDRGFSFQRFSFQRFSFQRCPNRAQGETQTASASDLYA